MDHVLEMGDLWIVENLSEDEQYSSESKSYRQGICDYKKYDGRNIISFERWCSI